MTKNKTNKKATIILRIIAAIAVLIAIIIVSLFISSIVEKRTLLDKGISVTGTVTERDVHTSVSRGSSLTTREITYSFSPKDSEAKIITSDYVVSKQEYNLYPVGASIPITYLPDEPSKNQPSISLTHMPTVAVPFLYLILVIATVILSNKFTKKILKKYNFKSPSWSFYLTSFGVFIACVATASLWTILISKLIGLLLS